MTASGNHTLITYDRLEALRSSRMFKSEKGFRIPGFHGLVVIVKVVFRFHTRNFIRVSSVLGEPA